MSKKTKFTDPDTEINGTVIHDFLPPPSALAFKEPPASRVTITMTRSTVEFFKEQAKKNGTKYQTMMRALLDSYVEKYSTRKRKAVA